MKTTSQLVHEYEEQMFKRLQTQVVKVVRANSLLSGNYASKKLQTGLLGIDLLLGGGIRPGTWYTSFGLEQSGKSTLAAQTMIAAYRENVPMVHFWDYEGSTGADTMYLERQMRASGVKEALENVMGDPEEAKPIAYWGEDVLETFFDTMAALLRRMPDRQFIDGKWFYVFDDDKYGKEMTDGKHDKSIKSKFGRLAVPGHANALGGLVLLDSYPAMNPRALDTDDSKAGMALQARMFSEGVRKIRGKLRPKGVTIVGVNQLREKPGVMFGTPFYEPCFIGETKVLLADGTSIPIREIVENKLDVEVLSFDKETGKVAPNKVIGWKDNGFVPRGLLVKVKYKAYGNADPVCDFTCTKSHSIWTMNGMVAAGDLKAGSKIFVNFPCRDENGVIKNRLLVTDVVDVEPSDLTAESVRVFDLTVENNHTYFVVGNGTTGNGFRCDSVAVSNCGGALKFASDGRIKCTQIANPWGEGRIQQEPSVDNEGTDSYQHMKYKLEKNKVGGINNFEVYQRVWVSDKNGNAHGFDKVADTYQYLSVTGQISGTRAKFLLPNELGLKHMNYSQFKQLIIGSKSMKQSVAKQLGAKNVPNIRAFCGHQIETGVAQELAKKNANKAKKDNT